MTIGSAESERTAPARRRTAGWLLAGLVAVAVGASVLLASGWIPLPSSGSGGHFRITAVIVSFTGSGASALCSGSMNFTSTCGSGEVVCDPTSLCNETLHSGEVVPIADGVRFVAMLSDTFDCNYTFSIAAVSAAGAFSVAAAQANGSGLPANIGFGGSNTACVTETNIAVAFSVGDQGPRDQALNLTVSVAEEVR